MKGLDICRLTATRRITYTLDSICLVTNCYMSLHVTKTVQDFPANKPLTHSS